MSIKKVLLIYKLIIIRCFIFKMTTNIILLGNTSVGKTTLLSSYIEEKFIEHTIPTIGIDSRVIKKNNYFFKVNIFIKNQYLDTCGTDKFNSIQFTYIKNGDAILLIYDPSESNETIKDNLLFWFRVINENYLGKQQNIWLIANNKNKHKTINEKEETDKIKKLLPNEKFGKIKVVNNLTKTIDEVNVNFF